MGGGNSEQNFESYQTRKSPTNQGFLDHFRSKIRKNTFQNLFSLYPQTLPFLLAPANNFILRKIDESGKNYGEKRVGKGVIYGRNSFDDYIVQGAKFDFRSHGLDLKWVKGLRESTARHIA